MASQVENFNWQLAINIAVMGSCHLSCFILMFYNFFMKILYASVTWTTGRVKGLDFLCRACSFTIAPRDKHMIYNVPASLTRYNNSIRCMIDE